MAATFYHGSDHIIAVPRFHAGNPHNDYGYGFYLTHSKELAGEWACARGENGFINRYSVELENLSILSLTGGAFHILNWLAILLENRTFRVNSDLADEGRRYILAHFLPDYKDADLIIGYRADDSYFSFAGAFLNNGISLYQLGKAMELGGPGLQTVLKSRRSFGRIRFEEAVPAEKDTYYPLAAGRDQAAREQFRSMRGSAKEGIYLIDIMREEWENDDARLQRIVLG